MTKILNKNKIKDVLHYFSKEDAQLLILYYGLFSPSLDIPEIKKKLGIPNLSSKIDSLNSKLEEIFKNPIIPKRRLTKEEVSANINYFGESFASILALYYGLKDGIMHNEYEISAMYNMSPQYILGLITRMEAYITEMIATNNYHSIPFHKQPEVFRVHDASNVYRTILDLNPEEQEIAAYFYGLYNYTPHTMRETADKMHKNISFFRTIINRINIRIKYLLILDYFLKKDQDLLTYYYGLKNQDHCNYTKVAILLDMEREDVKKTLKDLDMEVERRLDYERIKLLLQFRPKSLNNLTIKEIRTIMLYVEYKTPEEIARILEMNEYEVLGIINRVLNNYHAIYTNNLEKKLKL